MAHIDPPNVDPPSSPPPRRHALALVSGARALFAHILPRFHQSQPNTNQSTDPQLHPGQPVVSIHAPAQVQVLAVQVCLPPVVLQ